MDTAAAAVHSLYHGNPEERSNVSRRRKKKETKKRVPFFRSSLPSLASDVTIPLCLLTCNRQRRFFRLSEMAQTAGISLGHFSGAALFSSLLLLLLSLLSLSSLLDL
jgi:hypothetical protein